MFWLIFIAVFLVACTGLILLVRSRGGGGGVSARGDVPGVDNHNALQNGAAQVNTMRNRSGGPFIP